VLYTYYDYLDLPPGASAARIEAAYQTIKQRLDAGTDETLVRLIHEAHALLSDPDQRHVYDEELERSAGADAELKAILDSKPADASCAGCSDAVAGRDPRLGGLAPSTVRTIHRTDLNRHGNDTIDSP
jgi:DnaJ-class molecular chaperone